MDLIAHIEGPEVDFPPEYRNYLIYGDESGIHKAPYYGWGTLWIPAERRGDLSSMLAGLKRKHGFHGEVKWNKLKGRAEHLAIELIDEFFRRNWMMFHCLIVKRSEIRVDLFEGGLPEARLHHLTTMLRKKIEFFGAGASDKVYHVRVDPLPSAYEKEDEKIWKITNTLGDPPALPGRQPQFDISGSRFRAASVWPKPRNPP